MIASPSPSGGKQTSWSTARSAVLHLCVLLMILFCRLHWRVPSSVNWCGLKQLGWDSTPPVWARTTLLLNSESQPQLKEFRYLRVLFTGRTRTNVTVKNQPGGEALDLPDNLHMFSYSRPASTLLSYLLASLAETGHLCGRIKLISDQDPRVICF